MQLEWTGGLGISAIPALVMDTPLAAQDTAEPALQPAERLAFIADEGA